MKRNQNMKQLNVDLTEELKKAIKAAAALDGMTMKAWAAAALKYQIDQRKKEKLDHEHLNSISDSTVAGVLSSPGKPASSKPFHARAKRESKKH